MTEQLNELLEISQIARKRCNDQLCSISNNFNGSTVNKIYEVQLTILSRIMSSQAAIEILLEHGLHAEAAIIALSQFELRLDILYIGDKVERATKWLVHNSKTRQPWGVKRKIEEVYVHDPTMKESQHDGFRVLSQVKHGNPVAGSFGFNVRKDDQRITIAIGRIDDTQSRIYSLLICGLSIFQFLEAVEGCTILTSIDNNLHEELSQLKLRAAEALAR